MVLRIDNKIGSCLIHPDGFLKTSAFEYCHFLKVV